MLTIFLVLLVVGVLVTVVLKYTEIAQPFKNLIIAVMAIGMLLWVLDAFGLLGRVGLQLPRAHPAGCSVSSVG